MITETFDDKTNAIINPDSCYGKHNKVCDICIATFSDIVVRNILREFRCTQIAAMTSVNGNIPIYKFTYKGEEVALYMTLTSSAGAGTCVEDSHCLIGATKYIMFGSCGTLDQAITAGKLIVPTYAYRDEGFSYHYAEAEDYIQIRNAEKTARFFDELGLPYVMGRTWTTDGIYRETSGNMKKRKFEGCIAVDMECAGVQAVCNYRELDFYDFLISGDLLDAPDWERRILGSDEEATHQLNNFYIALEIAAR